MEILLGVGAMWVAAATVVTVALSRTAGQPQPFDVEKPRPLHFVG